MITTHTKLKQINCLEKDGPLNLVYNRSRRIEIQNIHDARPQFFIFMLIIRVIKDNMLNSSDIPTPRSVTSPNCYFVYQYSQLGKLTISEKRSLI